MAAHEHGARVQGLYTFGSPRVGNGQFVTALLGRMSNIHRFVHHADAVTTVPPEGVPPELSFTQWLGLPDLHVPGASLRYAHVGHLHFISGGNTWRISEGAAAKQSLSDVARYGLASAKEAADALTHDFSLFDLGTWPIACDAVADHAPIYYADKIYNALGL
jgi:hypothetical protein